MRLPPLKSLQVFLFAAEHQSFKVAAEKLFVSQAAISQQIRLLEEYFETPLFERESKQTRLNSKGQTLFPFIKNAFNEITQGVQALAMEPNPHELRITALHSVTSLILIPQIAEFQLQHPDLSIQFSPNNKLDLFQSDDVDVAIRRGLGKYDGLESRKLVDDAIVLVASPLIKGLTNKDVKNISKLPLLLDTSSDILEAVDDFCRRFNLDKGEFNVSLKTTDALPIIQHALSGQGMAFVSRVLVEENLNQGQLINVFDYVYNNPRTLYLVAPPHHFDWPKVKKFEQWVKTVFTC